MYVDLDPEGSKRQSWCVDVTGDLHASLAKMRYQGALRGLRGWWDMHKAVLT